MLTPTRLSRSNLDTNIASIDFKQPTLSSTLDTTELAGDGKSRPAQATSSQHIRKITTFIHFETNIIQCSGKNVGDNGYEKDCVQQFSELTLDGIAKKSCLL